MHFYLELEKVLVNCRINVDEYDKFPNLLADSRTYQFKGYRSSGDSPDVTHGGIAIFGVASCEEGVLLWSLATISLVVGFSR